MMTTDRAVFRNQTIVVAPSGAGRGVVRHPQTAAIAAVRLQTPEPPAPTEIPPIEPPDPSGPPLDPPVPDMPPIGDPAPGQNQPMGASQARIGLIRHTSRVPRRARFFAA